MDLAEKIKREREKRGIKQVDMANALNLERSNYTRMENRGSKMTLDQIQGIAEVIGISVLELMDIEIPKLEEKNETRENDNIKKIKFLEKRIEELEDRIGDKNIIIKNSYNKLDIISEVINDLIEEYIYGKANKWGLLTFEQTNLEQINMFDDRPFIWKGTQENNIKLFKSKGLKWRYDILPEDLEEVIEKAYHTDSESLCYLFRMGLAIGSDTIEMRQITNTFKSHLKDSKISFFTEHMTYFNFRFGDKVRHANDMYANDMYHTDI